MLNYVLKDMNDTCAKTVNIVYLELTSPQLWNQSEAPFIVWLWLFYITQLILFHSLQTYLFMFLKEFCGMTHP